MDTKKAAAIQIEKYYFQLRDGCGNSMCENSNCASSGKVPLMSNEEVAVKALQLFYQRAKFCTPANSNINNNCTTKNNILSDKQNYAPASDFVYNSSSHENVKTVNQFFDLNLCLTEQRLRNTIKNCESNQNYAELRILLRTIFSNVLALKHSFLLYSSNCNYTDKEMKNLTSTDKNNEVLCDELSKEYLRSSLPDLDKDIDSVKDAELVENQATSQINSAFYFTNKFSHKLPSKFQLDIESLRRSYELLYQVPEKEFISTLMDAIRQLLQDSLGIQLKAYKELTSDLSIVNIFIILLEDPNFSRPDYTEEVLVEICKVISQLEIDQKVALVWYLALEWDTARLRSFLESLHHLITIRLLTTEFTREFIINDDSSIASATAVIKLIYYAAICSGELDKPLLSEFPEEALIVKIPEDYFTGSKKESVSKPVVWDSLAKHLGIHPLDSKAPAIPFQEFYDEFLSDQLEMDRDFAYFKAESKDHCSFLSYPFILTPATKALGLYYDNRIRMFSERRLSIYQTVMEGTPANPYLSLKIRRDHIIADALIELELVAMENGSDLKKQLVVEFEGEQGIDEGGVSKEFFQLITEQIFNEDYAMFSLNAETETFWFNPTSFENNAQFTLVGVVLGLAIYNNVILDLHFPPVIYKKLCGKPGTFSDLAVWNPTLYRSLTSILHYNEDDIEEVFMQTFRVGYEDVFGASLHHDLKTDGANIFVNNNNKKEFVDLYSNFLLNNNVERQFAAFKRGFDMVTEDSPLLQFFRPYELELLLCGSQNYDFAELKKSTEYDGGYTVNSEVISWFWELVDEIGESEKKQLLQFTTGSARVPVGGLARLKLIIARHGPDTERLPTAHTCFNVLLLPEYSSKEKLKERLLKAIKYAQGFGML